MHERRCILPITYDQRGGLWWGDPQEPFRPSGLAIWGAPARATVTQCLIGPQLQLVCAFGAVPAKFFAQADSYAQLAKLVELGKEPPAWCAWDPIAPGVRLRLELKASNGLLLGPGDGIECCCWGTAVSP
jgi:hypothetical protein